MRQTVSVEIPVFPAVCVHLVSLSCYHPTLLLLVRRLTWVFECGAQLLQRAAVSPYPLLQVLLKSVLSFLCSLCSAI